MFHVFTDGKDSFVKSILEAIEIMQGWKEEPFYCGRVRIYEDTEDAEDYIYGEGGFPF